MIRIGAKPPASDDPIDHLKACHRRIEDRLAVLERAAGALPDRKDEALAAIASALRFLDSSGVLHTVDEEESLFPRLEPKLTGGERDYLHSLERQHRAVDAAYARMKDALAKDDVPGYRSAVAEVAALYREHIASEDDSLMRIARRELGAEDLAAMKAEMVRRRRGESGNTGIHM